LREAGRFEAFMVDRKYVAGAFWREAATGGVKKCGKKADGRLVLIQSERKRP
jgi:hypothetical protein